MNLSELVVRVLATFGAERVLWGSDFPYLRPGLSYADNLTGARALLAGLDAAAVENVLGGNARRLWWSGAAAPSGME